MMGNLKGHLAYSVGPRGVEPKLKFKFGDKEPSARWATGRAADNAEIVRHTGIYHARTKRIVAARAKGIYSNATAQQQSGLRRPCNCFHNPPSPSTMTKALSTFYPAWRHGHG